MVQVGEYERAVEDYTQALQVDPHNSYAFYNRGITRDRSGDYEGAIIDFSHAITLDPANADFFHNRGFSRRKMVSVGPLLLFPAPHTGPCICSVQLHPQSVFPESVMCTCLSDRSVQHCLGCPDSTQRGAGCNHPLHGLWESWAAVTPCNRWQQ